jgi:hypothetical protein
VTRSAVLQSARSIEELAASDAPAAARRARALLRYVDRNADSIPADLLPPLGSTPPPLPITESWHEASEAQPNALAPGIGAQPPPPPPPPPPLPPPPPANDGDEQRLGPSFESQLCGTAWLPVLTEPPHPGMPWSERRGAVAAPAAVRPAGDGWLVSHRLGLLDGEVSSPYLWRLFGWHELPRPAVVCAQLVHFAGSYDAVVGPSGAELWGLLLTPAYTQLAQLVETAAFVGVGAMLRTRPCLWLGEETGFLSPEHVAMDAAGLGGDPALLTLALALALALTPTLTLALTLTLTLTLTLILTLTLTLALTLTLTLTL